jgi:hypothetical protein
VDKSGGDVITYSSELCVKVVSKSNIHSKTPSIVTHTRDIMLRLEDEHNSECATNTKLKTSRKMVQNFDSMCISSYCIINIPAE